MAIERFILGLSFLKWGLNLTKMRLHQKVGYEPVVAKKRGLPAKNEMTGFYLAATFLAIAAPGAYGSCAHNAEHRNAIDPHCNLCWR